MVLHRVIYQRFRLILPSFNVWLRLVLDDDFKSDAFVQLGVVLYQEVFEVIECDVDVLIGVLHVLVQCGDQLIKHHRALLVKLRKLIVDVVYEFLRQVLWMRFSQLINQCHTLIK